MRIRVFEAFAGYGSQAIALRRLRENYPDFLYQLVGISEINKKALKAYRALHGHVRNFGDIEGIEWGSVPDFDLFTYSFPCQDISLAGKKRGLEEGSKTRSSLLWECERAIQEKRPRFLLMENVKALTFRGNMPHFEEWQQRLESYGYTNHWTILNAKDFGVPQNRERVFMVSVLGESSFAFPKGFPLEIRLEDVLEEEVDEMYYVKPIYQDELVEKFYTYAVRYNHLIGADSERIIQLFNLYPKVKGKDCEQGRVYSPQGLAPTISALSGGGLVPKILLPVNTDRTRACSAITAHLSEAGWSDYRPFEDGNHAPHTAVMEFTENIRIRKLTPMEVGRLMGLKDSEVRKLINARIRNTPLYRMLGNSIVVDVLYHIFHSLFIGE